MAGTRAEQSEGTDRGGACPNCGFRPSIAAEHRDDSHLYRKAKGIQKGFHDWHVLLKNLSFWFLGCALWLNDLNDNFVRYACSAVDAGSAMATRSTLWRWTAGWFWTELPQVSPIYGWYSFVTGAFAIVGVVWLSRWWFWNNKVHVFEQQQGKDDFKDSGIAVTLLTIAWLVEWSTMSFLASRLVNANELLPNMGGPTSSAFYLWCFAIATFIILNLEFNTPLPKSSRK